MINKMFLILPKNAFSDVHAHELMHQQVYKWYMLQEKKKKELLHNIQYSKYIKK